MNKNELRKQIRAAIKAELSRISKDKDLLNEMFDAVDDFDLDTHNDPIKRRYDDKNKKH
jgi:hypothetical protein